jgi:hypothetical protein
MFVLRRASNRLPALARNNNTGKGRDLLGIYRARGNSPIGTRKLDWHGHFVGFAAEQICAPQDHNQSSRENARKGLKPLRASAGRHARVHPCTIRRHARGRVAFCPAEGAEMRGPTSAGRSDHFRATASRRTLSAEGLYVFSPAASSSTHASSTSPSPSPRRQYRPILAHVTEDMRMVLWWQRTHAHEFLGADFDDLNAQVVMEMSNGAPGRAKVPGIWK